MKRLLTSCLLALGALANGRCDVLGDVISLTPPAGWERVQPHPACLDESPFPTLKYLLHDGQQAEIVITLLPANIVGFPVTDAESLTKFSLIAAQPYLPASAPQPRVAEFTLPDGLAIAITIPRPAVAPAEAREHIATVTGLLIGSKQLVHVAILHEPGKTPEFLQALQTMFSIRPVNSALLAQNKR